MRWDMSLSKLRELGWTGKPGVLQPTGPQRVGHDWAAELNCSSVGKESDCNAGDLGWEDPLEKETATHSSTLAWRIPWTEGPSRLQSMGSQESDRTDGLSTAQSTKTEPLNFPGLWVKHSCDFHDGPVVKTVFPLQRAQVPSLVREVRSCLPLAKKKKSVLVYKHSCAEIKIQLHLKCV